MREGVDLSFYPAVGYLVRGPRAIRIDALERVQERLIARGDAPAEPPTELGAQLGTRKQELAAVLRSMGWRTNKDGTLERIASRERSATRRRG